MGTFAARIGLHKWGKETGLDQLTHALTRIGNHRREPVNLILRIVIGGDV